MPNAIAYTLANLTYAGTDLQRLDLSVHLECSVGLDEIAEYRGNDTIVPALAGRISRLGMPDVLPIELAGIVQARPAGASDSGATFREVAEELKALFVPGGAPQVLTGLGPDGSTYTINAKPISNPLRWGPQDVPGFRELTVILQSLDPLWVVT